MTPFFTIITATRNAAQTLPGLLASLASQTCRDFVWVVQDAVSTDATLTLIEAWRERLPQIDVASQADTGIYQAWNRALDRAKIGAKTKTGLGQWVLFLGADDALDTTTVLEDVKAQLQHAPAECIFAMGNMRLMAADGSSEAMIVDDMAKTWREVFMLMTPVPHPALFARGALFQQRQFDESYKIAGDYAFILAHWQRAAQALPLHIFVTRMAKGGISDNPQYYTLAQREKRRLFFAHKKFRTRDIPLIGFLLCESYLYPYKMSLKSALITSTWGKHVWNALHTLRRALLRKT